MSEASAELQQQIRTAITNAYYDARNDGQTMEMAADNATTAVLGIAESVHKNAVAYGRLLGEEAVLDSVLNAEPSTTSLLRWHNETRRKIEAAK